MVKHKSIKRLGGKRYKYRKSYKRSKRTKRPKKRGGTRMMMPSGYYGKRHPRYQSRSKRCLKVIYV